MIVVADTFLELEEYKCRLDFQLNEPQALLLAKLHSFHTSVQLIDLHCHLKLIWIYSLFVYQSYSIYKFTIHAVTV